MPIQRDGKTLQQIQNDLCKPRSEVESSANFRTTLERHQVEVRGDDPLQDVDQNLEREAGNVLRLKNSKIEF